MAFVGIAVQSVTRRMYVDGRTTLQRGQAQSYISPKTDNRYKQNPQSQMTMYLSTLLQYHLDRGCTVVQHIRIRQKCLGISIEIHLTPPQMNYTTCGLDRSTLWAE